MNKNDSNTLRVKLLASVEKVPGFLTVRLAFDQPQPLLSGRCLEYQGCLGVVINVSEDYLRADMLFQGELSVSVGLQITLNIVDLDNNADISANLVLVPQNSLVRALALAQSEQKQWKKALFLFECDHLPLPIRPSLHIISTLPSYVTGNFQLLENLKVNARIASLTSIIGCYDGTLLDMLTDYLSAFYKNNPEDKRSCYILPGLPSQSSRALAKLELECCYSEHC